MATRTKTPADQEAGVLYETDLYAWSQTQAALLRTGRRAELDLEHLAEEIEDVGASLYRETRRRVRTIIEHLLELEHSPAIDPRAGWTKTIRTQRADLAEDLTASLRPRIEHNLTKFYETARLEAETALRAHGETEAADALPDICPYDLDQIMADWLPHPPEGTAGTS